MTEKEPKLIEAGPGLPEGLRIACLINGWAAYCPNTGAYLARSSGRAKYGNKSRYRLHWNGHYKVIRADGDSEAIDLANKHLAKVGVLEGAQ